MADEKDDAPAGMLGDALTAGEQAYFDSGGQNTEGLTTEDKGAAAAAPDTSKTSDDTGKPSPDGAAKPDVKADAKVDAKPDGKVEAKADAKPEDDDTAADVHAQDPQKPPPQRVSYHKFRREEARRKEVEKKLSDLTERFTRGDERLKLLTEALTPKPDDKTKEDPEPDPEKDIFGWIQWSKRDAARLREEIKVARQGVDQTQQTIQQRDAADGLKTSFQQDAVRFSQTTPDFVNAYNHMFSVRGAMLEDQGYQPEQIQGIIAREERELVQRAVQAGKSPSEMIYQMAQRFGYQKAAPQAGDAAGEAKPAADAKPSGNGAAVAAEPAKPSVTEEIKRIQAGQAAGKTLSGAGGAANELSVEGLLALSEDEFAALLRKSPGKVNALMGAA
jgi:hypothetical protein